MASYFVLLLISLNALSILANYVSIDCGTSDSYTEKSISWEGDENLIQYGKPMAVETINPQLPRSMSTLRVFTTRAKNCYSINAEKGQLYLVRASFYYGNYDKKSTPPIFDLQFDGNHWSTVNTSIHLFAEAIFVAKKNTISVCVAQIFPNMFPFISSLELRSLPSHMYKNVDRNHALIVVNRQAYGTKGIVRYPDDEYDRIWGPVNDIPDGSTVASSDAINIDVKLEDAPPEVVMRNALIASNIIPSLRSTLPLGDQELPIYMNLYFSEVTQLDSTQKRSFIFAINGVPFSKPITPPYGSATERYLANFTATSNTVFSLEATSTSTLPPLINAIEVFSISSKLTDGTSSDDVEGLALLQEKFDILKGWNGDPCLPSPYTWDWVNCSMGATPRVTALYLGGFGLSGSLPDFSSMDALETIDLSNNSLNGAIPDFFSTLPNLKLLNLADNDFSGPVPSSLSKNTKIKLVFTGNPDLCASGKSCQTKTNSDPNSDDSPTSSSSSRNKKNNNLPIILGATIPSVALFLAIVGALAILHHQRKSAAVAATATAGHTHAGNGLNGTAHQMMGNVDVAVMNEIKVNVNEETTAKAENQMDHNQAHEDHHAANNA